jgi:CarD family transcriptional regulator
MVGFKVGQKVVYPNHGIGTIEQIEQKQIGATLLPFYTLRLAANNSLVLVPVSNA